jgi:DNA-binding transcriptional LysR family regulator
VLTKHGAFLTAEGEELFRDLARIDREVLLATKGLRAKGISPEGNVRIGISDGLGFVFLVPKIEAFSRDFSKVHLHFTRPLPFHALRENKMDVVVGFEPDLSSDVVSERVGTVHFVPFAGAKYVAQNGMPRLHDIERHSLIATHRFAGGDTWDAWQSLALRGKTTHSCDTSVTYGMMVKAGLGIGLLPSYVVCDPSFVPLELGVCVDVPLYAVALRERVKARAVGIALNLVRSTLQETPWLAGELTLDVKANGVPPGYNALFNLSEADLCPAVAY